MDVQLNNGFLYLQESYVFSPSWWIYPQVLRSAEHLSNKIINITVYIKLPSNHYPSYLVITDSSVTSKTAYLALLLALLWLFSYPSHLYMPIKNSYFSHKADQCSSEDRHSKPGQCHNTFLRAGT